MVDRISLLPDSVISQGILQRLELRDAVRTSALSRSWRYKWTLIPDLKLGVMFCGLLMDRKVDAPSEYLNLVNSILMQHTAPLDSVELLFPPLEFPIGAFDTAIHFILRRGVRALNMWDFGFTSDPLPSYLPFCPSLESLDFYKGRFVPPPGFAGFPNLKSIALNLTRCNASGLSEFISNCTKLEKLVFKNLSYLDESRLRIRAPNLRHLELRDTKFLQLLEIPSTAELNLCLDSPANHGKLVLSCCLVHLEHLKLGGNVLKSLSADGIPRELSSRLPELKTLTAYGIDIRDLDVFSCLLSLIVRSHRLRRLNVYLFKDPNVPKEAEFGSELAKHADHRFSDLTHARISFIFGSKTELGLIEFLLAHSPILEELSIKCPRDLGFHEERVVYRDLVRFRRASPIAEIKYLYPWIDSDAEELYSQMLTEE